MPSSASTPSQKQVTTASTNGDSVADGKINGGDATKPQELGPSAYGKRKLSVSDDDAYDDDDSTHDSKNDDVGVGKPGNELSKMKRERRLAMNRTSARARRKRKKVLLDTLANQVTELTKQHQALELTNGTLRARVQQLEASLTQSQATIATLLQQQPASSATAAATTSVEGPSDQQQVSAPAAKSAEPSPQEALLALLQAQQQQQQQQQQLAGLLSAASGNTSAIPGIGFPDINALLAQQKLLDAQRILSATGGAGGGPPSAAAAALMAAALGGGGVASGTPSLTSSNGEDVSKKSGSESMGNAGALANLLAARMAGDSGGI